MEKSKPKVGRRATALIWLLLISVAIALLIYFELIAVLYVIATLALVALLLIVAFADLENVGRDDMKAAE